jgi:cardiolipin synthase A/B
MGLALRRSSRWRAKPKEHEVAFTTAIEDPPGHAERLVSDPVRIEDLALAFPESAASSAAVHVGGREFFPRIIDDIAAASSSVHINQFGFRPGAIGEQFADALIAKASQGVAVRVVVDGQGSRPDRSGRAFYERLLCAGIEVRVVRGTRLRAATQPAWTSASRRWNLHSLGHVDHRKCFIVDGRIGWVGGGGIEDHFDDGRFHDLFLRVTGAVVSQLQLVFVASFRWLGGTIALEQLGLLFPSHQAAGGTVRATVLHNAPGNYRPITTAIAELLDEAAETLDVVNPYVTDRGMIDRIEAAAKRGVRVRLFVPARPNNIPCGQAQRSHHRALLDAGVRILEHPAMLHAKAFLRDGNDVLAGTCNLEAWSLKRFFEIDLRVRSDQLAAQFDHRFSAPAEAVSVPGRAPTGAKRVIAKAFSTLAPVL